MDNFLDIVVTSDLHGNFPSIEKPFDLLLLCGDNSPAYSHYFGFQIGWIQKDFANWIKNLPFKDGNSKVVFIAGNHDFWGKIEKEHLDVLNITTNNRCVYLKNSVYNFKYYFNDNEKFLKIFGTPFCKIFGDWAFMVDASYLKKYYSECPDDCDIFISHDSPTLNGLGTINDGLYRGFDAGNKILSDIIIEKKPKFFFSGHIHSGNHNFENINGTWMANVSYVDEKYRPANTPLFFKIDKQTKNIIL